MLAFLTSLRSKQLSSNWAHHVWLLDQVITSMLRPNGDQVAVIVGCHEIPESTHVNDNRVHFVQVTYAPPKRVNDDMCADKVLKLTAASRLATKLGYRFIAFNDADDLVNARVFEHVKNNQDSPGWYSAQQNFYTYGSRFYRKSRIDGGLSGPFVIVRSDLIRYTNPPFDGFWQDLVRRGGETNYLCFLSAKKTETCTLAAVGHAYFRELMSHEGHPLAPLPFPANLAINHHDSTSHVPGGIGAYGFTNKTKRGIRELLSRKRHQLRLLLTVRPLTNRLRDEFNIPNEREIPKFAKRAGSILWR